MTSEIDDLDGNISKLKAQWEVEKNSIQGEAGIKDEIDKVKTKIAEAERNTDLQTAAELKYGKLMELEKKLQSIQGKERSENQLLKEEIDGDDIAEIVSKWTGVPVNRLMESEMQKLLRMEDVLHKRLIGQDEAVNTVSDAIRRARSGLKDPKRPIGTFIFLGPTGVGKTELAKSLADFMFNDEDAIVRIDMSEYMEKFSTSRLIGSPPGYVGYEEGGVLTEKVRRHPYSVVLLDEIEKAHPDIFNLLLQLLEEGELCDNLGHTVNFRNTVIIMTSNAGARQITNEGKVGFGLKDGVISYDEIKSGALNELKKLLNPELINRIDEVIVFNALSKTEVKKILDIQINELTKRLAERKLTINITESAKEYLVENGYNPAMGARPMKRLLRKEIEDPLALEILKDSDNKKHFVNIDCKNQKIYIYLTETEKSNNTEITEKQNDINNEEENNLEQNAFPHELNNELKKGFYL